LRITIIALLAVAGAVIWNRRPQASSLPAETSAHSAPLVVEGRGLRVLDLAAAGELFQLEPTVEDASPAAVLVPAAAVITRRGEPYVLVARGVDRIEPVRVQRLHADAGRVAVAGAVRPGDRVVGGGAIYLLNMLVLQGAL
jgi:hypothetical protein